MIKQIFTNVDKVEKHTFFKQYSAETLTELKDNLAIHCVEKKELDDKLKEAKDRYKELVKTHVTKISNITNGLKLKGEEVTEDCGVEFRRELGIADIFNSEGEKVGIRSLTADEKNEIPFLKVEKTGTNH